MGVTVFRKIGDSGLPVSLYILSLHSKWQESFTAFPDLLCQRYNAFTIREGSAYRSPTLFLVFWFNVSLLAVSNGETVLPSVRLSLCFVLLS